MQRVDIGFEVLSDIIEEDDAPIEGVAVANDPNRTRAIGVENAEFGEAPNGFTINLDDESNSVEGTATAEAGEEAFADGIRNIGRIELANTPGFLEGTSESTTIDDGELTFATGINSTNGGIVRGAGSAVTLEGEATSIGQSDVGAFGVLVADTDTDRGDDTVQGTVIATGVSSTDARGISVGFSDIDDDTTAGNSPGLAPTASGAAEVGTLLTSSHDDTIEGIADVMVAGQDGDEIFFAGANGIVNDGGTIDQLEELLATVGKDLTNFETEDVEAIIDQLDTSLLDTGAGDDDLIAEVELNVFQAGEGADSDLEVIGDGIENAGVLLLGDGDDFVESTVDVNTTISGASGLADALDNSSVGIITSLQLDANNESLFDLGAGDDTFTSDISATAVDDLSAADGLGNRGIFTTGAGSDTLNLASQSEFVLESENDEEQQESQADGWDNRSQVFLDDREGLHAGHDSVTTSATAFGERVLTIAEGLESRAFFDAGDGDDTFHLSAEAATDTGALPDNLTQAAGLQTEQVDEGEFLLREGDNSIIGEATATSEAVAGGSEAEFFTPTTFAFGITQMTADANNTNAESQSLIESGSGDDLFEGTATAFGQTDVVSFGVLLENAIANGGEDTLLGDATAESEDVALATGIAVGLAEDVFAKQNSTNSRPDDDFDYGLGAEAGFLNLGADDDTLNAVAEAFAVGEAVARGIDGANGNINLGSGNDTVTAEAIATSENGEIEAIGIFGGQIEAREGSNNIRTRSNDDLVGSSDVSLHGGQGLGGDVAVSLGAGNDTLLSFGEAIADGGSGIDTLQFEFSFREFIEGGGSIDISGNDSGKVFADFTFAGVTMEVRNFERLQFEVDFGVGGAIG